MRPLVILAVLFICFLSVLLLKYFLFGYVDWDLAFFSQASWKLLHGNQFVSLVGINYFGDHSYFFHFFILPFFYVFPSALTLIVLKLVAFFVAAYFLYRIAEERLGGDPAICVMLLYLFFPGNIFGLLYEFNPEAFASPFIVLMFVALYKKNVRLMMFWAIFLVLIKENMFLVAAAFGIRAIFVSDKNDRKWCILFTLACLVTFFYVVMIVIPYFRGLDRHAFSVRYAWLGNNIQEMLLTPLWHPQELWKRILYQSYLGHLFNYLLIPVLFSPLPLFMMSPLLLQHLFSGSIPEHTIYYHYVPAMAPFIFLAFIETLVKIGRSRMPLIMVLMIISLPVLFLYRHEAVVRDWNLTDKSRASVAWKLIKGIPEDAAVMTTFRFLAPLSSRGDIYSFHMLYCDEYNNIKDMGRIELNTHKAFILPERVSYALIDLDDPWYVATLNMARDSELKRINNFFHDPNWKVINSVERILLLKRN